MKIWKFTSLLLVGLFCIVFPPISHSISAAEPVLIDFLGVWTLKELGYSDLVFSCRQNIETISIEYRLPGDAAQGPQKWYVIHLDFLIEFSEQSADGRCYVSAFTNGRSCAQVKFNTTREGDSLTVHWSTVDLINGGLRHSTSFLSTHVTFSNYLQMAGVRPGLNLLTLKLEQYEGIKVKSLRVLDSSGIEYTCLSPPKLAMDIELPTSPAEVGETFEVKFRLSNVGDLAAKDVIVHPIYPKQALELIGENSYQVQSFECLLEGGFRFEALAEGEYEIIIDTQTKSGIRRPSARIQVPVASESRPPLGSRASIVSIFIVLGLLIGYLLWRKLWKGERSDRNRSL